MTKPGEKGMKLRSASAAAAHGGFTLVELLAIATVLTFLLVLLFPRVTQARQKAMQTTCQANLKQIGLALQAYANANRDYLPGPVEELANPRYDLKSTNELAWFIADRLGALPPGPQKRVVTELLCPAEEARRKAAVPYADYLLNDGRALVDPPFGRPGSPARPSQKLASLAATTAPATCVAMVDADKGNVNARLPGWKSLSYAPNHGKTRNQLYFDWHVASKGW
jgi:prepilin-type processing-associated H-X9-DG protein